MFCTACGSRNGVDSKFCAQCGHKLDPLASGRVTITDSEKALPPDEQVQALLEHAYQMRREGNFEAAIDYCMQALSVRPENTATHALLAQLYEATGDHARAVAQYERILELNPGSVADRVKLEDMRSARYADTRRPASSEPLQRTYIVERPNAWNVAGGALSLFAVCALAFAYLRQSSGAERTEGSSSKPPSRGSRQVASSDTNNSDGGYSRPQQTTQQPSIIYLDPTKIAGYPGYPPPATAYQPRNFQRMGGFAPQPPASTYKPAPQGLKVAQINTDDAPTPGKRVKLDEDDTSGQTVSIHVSSKTSQPDAPVVNISPASATTKSQSEPPGGDAQSLMAMAHDAAAREEFDRAIGLLRQALPTSGDSAATVNQDIASYYERLNEKKPSPSYQQSAQRYYGDAIQEFDRLNANGKLTPADRAARKACEIGKKKCGG
jgi:tetratricopeptide (TPR) repeat protein